jgi:hypothetical protein
MIEIGATSDLRAWMIAEAGVSLFLPRTTRSKNAHICVSLGSVGNHH